MLRLLNGLMQAGELLVAAPYRASRFLFNTLIFNPRLGRLRLIVAPAIFYVLFALALTYVYAPIRGVVGQIWMARVLAYADERSLGTAIYDAGGRFVGMFDPILDSEKDFNYTGKPIELPGYIAYPDHKSLHVGVVPQDYWQCLRYHEDRHLGGLINPFGIDLYGVLKIPLSTVMRSIHDRRPSLGVGGSTLSMQLARVFFKTPPSPDETAADKLDRKLKEWWLAPVIQWQLTAGDGTAMKRWTANHFPLAQRAGGQELYGVEETSLILFGKPAASLDRAEQYVLAAAVNQPVLLMGGNEATDRLRKASWARIAGTRAKTCADALITDVAERSRIDAELSRLAEAPPEPAAAPEIEEALSSLTPTGLARANVNPVIRANTLLPSIKYGVREELKSRFGFSWRDRVGAVHLTLDAAENLQFRRHEEEALAELDKHFHDHLAPNFTLDPGAAAEGSSQARLQMPDIVIAAADARGRLVRYFESNFNAAYFGTASARDPATGRYDPARESRAIASIGKMLAVIAVTNQGTDTPDSQWLDTEAPATGLEACGHGTERRLRTAQVTFACSLNMPMAWRAAQVPVEDLRAVADGFGITLAEPVTSAANLAKSMVVGHVAASPQTVHKMAAALLASLDGDGNTAMPAPTLIGALEPSGPATAARSSNKLLIPADLIKANSKDTLRVLLQSPLCYAHGTLHGLSDWCADRHQGVTLHFAKTGTRGNGAADPSAYDTVDLWVAGGIKFQSGPAYSYVVVIGSGSPSSPFARDLYAGQVAEPLLRVLLQDLEGLSQEPQRQLTDAR